MQTPYQGFAYFLLFLAPAFLSSNMIVARWTHELVPPIGLAFWRWTTVVGIMLPFTGRYLWRNRRFVHREAFDLIGLGSLGMGICSAFPYMAADSTTALNMGLIISFSPVLIILLAYFLYNERITGLQTVGVAISLIGLSILVCHGELKQLVSLRFNKGDLWMVFTAVGWAFYSVLLKHRPTSLDAMARFTAISAGGVLALLPFYLCEVFQGEMLRLNKSTIIAVGFVALVPGVCGYQMYGYVQRFFGAGRTGLMMYFMPIYNSILAFFLLGERLVEYHFIGAGLILAGLFLAMRKRET